MNFEFMQIVVWRFLQRSNGSDVLATKQALFYIILLQYIPRFARILPLTSELKRTSGVFAETAWAGAVTYLLLYMLASHVSFHFNYCMIPFHIIMHCFRIFYLYSRFYRLLRWNIRLNIKLYIWEHYWFNYEIQFSKHISWHCIMLFHVFCYWQWP